MSFSSYDYHHIYYITQNFTESVRTKLEYTLHDFSKKYELNIIENQAHQFTELKSLHGNTFTYSKLLLAELVPCDKVLYLDIDIVVNLDIKELDPFLLDLDDYLIMANVERGVKESLEKEFFIQDLKLSNINYFNAGVLLVNLSKWRRIGLTQVLLNFANEHRDKLKCADQTVINGAIDEQEIGCIPNRFNFRVENNLPKGTYDNSTNILHFYGRPKPWDILAELIHPHHKLFSNILKKIYFKDYNSIRDISCSSIAKFIRTYRSYLKVLFRIKM